jgi:catechol 2,3-dioxygenase-like lactoylglutathione lyase family enzyme
MKFLHLGVAVAKLEGTLESYAELFGYTLISGPFDDPIQKVSVCFMGSGKPGDAVVELIAPLTEDSPVKGVLARGGGAYHMCFETPGLDEVLTDVLAKGCLLVSKPVPAVAFGGRRIAWIYTPTRQLIELLEQEVR